MRHYRGSHIRGVILESPPLDASEPATPGAPARPAWRRLGARTVAECVAARRDNFLLLRLLAATLVIYGHFWALAANPTHAPDWLTAHTKVFTGTVAVEIFFVV